MNPPTPSFTARALVVGVSVIVGSSTLTSRVLAGPAESISEFRRAHGLAAVTVDPALMRLAREQAEAMAAAHHMDHSVKGSFGSRIAEYPTRHAAENIAWGNATFPATLEQWKNSSGHRANLLLNDASRIGIASAGSGHDTYWALILAAPRSTSPGKKKDVAGPKVAAAKTEPKKGLLETLLSSLPFSLGH